MSKFQTNQNHTTQLNKIDDVRGLLSGLAQAACEKAFQELPQIIVIGDQSSGKSSVLHRISGINLPTAGERCTVVPTMICLRRCNGNESAKPNKKVKVELEFPSERKTHVFPSTLPVKKAVAQAQKMATADAASVFAEKHTIRITVSGENLPNVTLVDLPGFTNKEASHEKQVKHMVKRFIDMPGTISLDVHPATDDHEARVCNALLREQTNLNRVSILTKADRIDASDSGSVTTFKKCIENGGMEVFVVVGKASSDENEKNLLSGKPFTGVGDSIEFSNNLRIGAPALKAYLEQRMADHMNVQFPKVLDALKDLLKDNEMKLEKLQAPVRILLPMVQRMLLKSKESQKALDDDIRYFIQKTRMKIQNHSIVPVATSWGKHSMISDDELVELEIGSCVYVSKLDDTTKFESATISRIEENMYYYATRDEGDKKEVEYKCDRYKKKTFFSKDVNKTDIIKDIEHLADKRGLRNLVHLDRQPIIHLYAESFSETYTAAFESYKTSLMKIMNDKFTEILNGGLDFITETCHRQSVKGAVDLLQQRFNVIVKTVEDSAADFIEDVRRCNSDPKLIWTSNTHYLNEVLKQMLLKDKESMAKDEGGAEHIYHNIRAFIKVQSKTIIETGCKGLLDKIVIKLDCELEKLLFESIGDMEKAISKEHSVAKTKKDLENNVQLLKKSIDIMMED